MRTIRAPDSEQNCASLNCEAMVQGIMSPEAPCEPRDSSLCTLFWEMRPSKAT